MINKCRKLKKYVMPRVVRCSGIIKRVSSPWKLFFLMDLTAYNEFLLYCLPSLDLYLIVFASAGFPVLLQYFDCNIQ